MASLFISYSRKDVQYARKLTEAFQDQGLDFWIDWEGIPPTVDWWKEIEKGIEEADVFLFLLSPDSTSSKVCKREIEHAVKNGKRLIPLVVRDIKGDESPIELAHLNWIFVRESDDFNVALDKLITAIKTDFAWVQAHRQLQVKALEWERNNRENSFLLHGKELGDAEFQLATNNSIVPHPTDLQRDYVFRSRQATDKQRRRTTSLAVSAGVIMAVLGVVALIQAGLARKAQSVAEQQRDVAIARQLVAQGETIHLTGSVRQQEIAFLLAAQSMKMLPSDNASQLLRDNQLGHPITQMNNDGTLTLITFSPDGQYVAAERCYKKDENGVCSETAMVVLDALTGRESSRMPHDDLLNSIAFSMDDKFVVSGSNKGLIQVWDTATGQEISRIVQDNEITSATLSHDGNYVVSAGFDRFIHVWSVTTGQEIVHFTSENGLFGFILSPDDKYVVAADGSVVHVWNTSTGMEITSVDHGDNVFSIAISPDSRYVVSGDSAEARFWDITTGKEIIRFRQGGVIAHAAFSPDGKYVVLGTGFVPVYINAGYTARVWEISTGNEIARMTHDNEITSVSFSPDGNYVVSGSADGTARVWETSTGQEISRMIHAGDVISAVFSPDGRYVVSEGSDGSTIVWEVVTDKPMITINHDVGVNSMDISADGEKVASGSGGCGANDDFTLFCQGAVRVWDASTGDEILHVDYDEFLITSVAISPDGKYVVVGSDDNVAIVLDILTGKEVARLVHDSAVLSVDISQDGNYVVAGSNDRSARVWDIATQKEVSRIYYQGKVSKVAFLPGDQYILTASDDGMAHVWEALTGKEIAHMTHNGFVTSIAFSMDGIYVASAGSDMSVRVWKATTGEEIAHMEHDGTVLAVAFSPDGKRIASGSDDNTARVWDVTTQQELNRITFDERVTDVAFSPDGSYLIAGSWDKTARVWDLETNTEVARMLHNDVVNVVSFSPDGRYAMSGGGTDLFWELTDGTVRMWLWRVGDLIAHVCSHLPRNLTPIEWKQYLGDKPYEAVCPNLLIEPTPDATEAP